LIFKYLRSPSDKTLGACRVEPEFSILVKRGGIFSRADTPCVVETALNRLAGGVTFALDGSENLAARESGIS